MFSVVAGTDAVGSFVNVLREEDSLVGSRHVSSRIVLETEDHGEAIRAAEQEKRRIRSERAQNARRASLAADPPAGVA